MMLYLDSSAIVKFYFKEVGSDAMAARATTGDQAVGASILSFAEVHSAMGRKYREGQISSAELFRLRGDFEKDWARIVDVFDINARTMAGLPKLVEEFPLKAADAIQLSTALWLKDSLEAESESGLSELLEFTSADQILVDIARKCGLRVFNPEEES
jgi:hypothetical protein